MLQRKTPLKSKSTLKRKTPLRSKTQLKSNSTLERKTPLKSRTPLKSKTALKSKSTLKSKTRLQSKAKLKTHSYKKTVEDPTLTLAFPKFARVRNQQTIEEAKLDYCELCGKPCYGNEPHHIIPRGAGGPDIKENLIQLCPICHTNTHSGHHSKEELFSIVGLRLGLSVDEIEETIAIARGRRRHAL